MTTKIAKKIVGFRVLVKEDLKDEAAAQAVAEALDAPTVDYDPSGEILSGAPMGVYDAKRYGAEYLHPLNGKQSLFINASFFPAKGLAGGEEVVAERWFEVFMPAGQREDIQPWVSVAMKLVTLCLQQGVPLSRVLKKFNCPGSDNIQFPLPGGEKKHFFTSEVQVVGQAFKNLAYEQGLLDIEGQDIPYFKRAVPRSPGVASAAPVEARKDTDDAQNAPAETSGSDGYPAHATTCAKCRTKAVVPRDGCLTCMNCGDSKCG